MNILITGRFGFIGSNFIHIIINKAEYKNVLNIDKLGYGSNKENFARSYEKRFRTHDVWRARRRGGARLNKRLFEILITYKSLPHLSSKTVNIFFVYNPFLEKK